MFKSQRFLIVFGLLWLGPVIGFVNAQESVPTVEYGIVNLKDYNFSEPFALNGRWNFYDGRMLSTAECKRQPENLVVLPLVWNKLRGNNDGQGYGTYYLKMMLPESLEDPGLFVPEMYSSYSLWVNNTLVASNGAVGATSESTKPQWLPQVVPFEITGDTLHVVLQIANFNHNIGGIKNPIYVGDYHNLKASDDAARMSTKVEMGVLLVLFLICAVIQLLQKEKKRIIFYFGLVCLSWAFRAGFTNLYVVNEYFPHLPWSLSVRIEYITLFLTMIWGILFIGRLFPNEENKIIKYLLVTGNSFFVAFAILTAPLSFTKGLNLYLIFCGILLVYGAVMVIRALINERIGVWYLVGSLLLAITIFALDVSAYKGIIAYRPVLFSVGYMTMYILMMIALLLNLKIFKSSNVSNTLTYDELYKDQY